MEFILSVFSLCVGLLLAGRGVSNAYLVVQNVSFDGIVYTYDLTGSLNTSEIVDEFDLWLNVDSANFQITGTPVGWSGSAFDFPFDLKPLAGDPSTYRNMVHWEYTSGPRLDGPADVGFQLQSQQNLGDIAYSWGDVSGHLPIPPEPVPEPGTLLLMSGGLLGFLAVRRGKRKD